MRRLLIIVSLLFIFSGCGAPRKMPNTPPPHKFPPPIYTDDFPSPEKLMIINLSSLRDLRPLIQRV